MAVDDVLAVGQRLELDQAGVQPFLVRLGSGELGLDLLVVDHAVLHEVDEEHPAGLQAATADDPGRVDVENADLAGQDDEVVVGEPVAGRAQAVAVEHGADDRAVGERDAGGTVPRLHQRGVELVEGLALRRHLGVVLPRLRDHHQHRVRQAAATEVQQLEHLVEAAGVAALGVDDRVEPVQVAGDRGRLEQRLTRAHPVAVALDRVDLAVVRDVAVWVGQRPARERVGGEPAVDQGERAGEALVVQVGVVLTELRGGEHALVGDGARGQAARGRRPPRSGPACAGRRPAGRAPGRRRRR